MRGGSGIGEVAHGRGHDRVRVDIDGGSGPALRRRATSVPAPIAAHHGLDHRRPGAAVYIVAAGAQTCDGVPTIGGILNVTAVPGTCDEVDAGLGGFAALDGRRPTTPTAIRREDSIDLTGLSGVQRV